VVPGKYVIARSVSSKRVAVAAGGVEVLDTVTLTDADVVVLPALSRATTVSVWAPLVAVIVAHGNP
jgi:hypothetical protein